MEEKDKNDKVELIEIDDQGKPLEKRRIKKTSHPIKDELNNKDNPTEIKSSSISSIYESNEYE